MVSHLPSILSIPKLTRFCFQIPNPEHQIREILGPEKTYLEPSLSCCQLKLPINREVIPSPQKPRRIPYPLKDKVQTKIDELLNLDIFEKVSGPTTWVSPAVIAPEPNKDDVYICVDMRHANEAIQREKLPIPTVDEVPEEMNGSAVFSKLEMNMRIHQIEFEKGSRDIIIFSAGNSLYRYKRLRFGANSALNSIRTLLGTQSLIAPVPPT